MQKRSVPAIHLERLLIFSFCCQVPKQPVFLREGIDQPRDPADCSQQHALQYKVVDSAEEQVTVAADVFQVGNAADVLRGLLDGDKTRFVGQFGEHCRRDVDAIGDRVVVTHDRQIRRPGHGAEMHHGLARVGPVDHARQHHETVRTRFPSVGGKPAGKSCRAFCHARQHRHATGDLPHCRA